MEYAPQYSTKQKLWRMGLAVAAAALLLWCHQRWVEPWWRDVALRPHCYQLWGYNGADYLWHVLFIGLPLLGFVLIAPFLWPLGLRVVLQRRFPPQGVKVYRPTRVRYGTVALVFGVAQLFVPLLFLALAWWGSGALNQMPPLDKSKLDGRLCDTPVMVGKRH